MDQEVTVDYALRTAWQSLVKMYNLEASKLGGTMTVSFTLLSINPVRGTNVTSLGPKMGMEGTSLSRTLKSMEENNLIERIPNPKDGRSIIIMLTPLGKKMREYSKSTVLDFNKKFREIVSEREIECFFQVIEKIKYLTQKFIKARNSNEKQNEKKNK